MLKGYTVSLTQDTVKIDHVHDTVVIIYAQDAVKITFYSQYIV